MSNDIDSMMKKFQEQREQEVTEHLATCERIRKKLELSPDALVLIDKVLREPAGFGGPRHAHDGPTMRAPLRLWSDKKIKRTDPINGKPTTIHARPQANAMRVEEIEILGRPEDWMIADVQVGARSQFPQSGPPVPGRLFAPGGTCHKFATETIQTAMDFDMLVHYVGDDPEGAIFEAVAMGTMAR